MKSHMMLHRRTVLAGLIATSLTPYFVAVARATEAQRGGTVTFVAWPGATVLNAAVTTAGPSTLVSSKLFDGLLDYDFGFVPRPQLAESWEVSEDGLRMTFRLRPDVKWHDGAPLTAADVKYSMMEVWKVHNARGRNVFAEVTDVETPDDLTVVFVMSRPSPVIIKALSAMDSPVLPAHLYEGTDPLTNPHNTAPVGTGPFKFVSFVPDESVVLERFDGYWQQDRPYLDRMIIRYIGDGATRTAMLETGEADLVASNGIPSLEIDRFRSMDGFEVNPDGYENVCIVCQLDFNLDVPELQDPRVRKAIAMVIDKEWLVRNVFFGLGVPATGPIHHQVAEYYTTDGVPSYPLDLAAAEALLDEAGFPRKADGVRLELSIDPQAFGEEPLRAAEYLREQLRTVGITLTVRNQDFATYVKRVYTDRDFQLNIFVAGAGADPTIGTQRFYWSKAFQPGVSFSNSTHYSNPRVDELLEATQVEMDPERRREQFAEFQKLVMEDLPTVPLVSTIRVTVANAEVRDYVSGAIGVFGGMANAWRA